MCPPHSVKMWPTPACLSVRATRCPPFRSAMLGRRRGGEVHDLELQAVRILEEHRVVARPVLRELARGPVERGEPARGHELGLKAIHVLAAVHAEGQVVEAGPLAVK